MILYILGVRNESESSKNDMKIDTLMHELQGKGLLMTFVCLYNVYNYPFVVFFILSYA